MTRPPIKRQSVIPRIDGILRDLELLRKLSAYPLEKFAREDYHFDVAKLHLREALEGVFHIGAHILSRLNGGRGTEYKDIARKLGELGIVEKEFANSALARMAGYRNRLTHFYAEIKPEELYGIIRDDLGDFDIFLHAVKNVLEHPEQFDLFIE